MPMEMPELDELFRKVLGVRVNLDVESNTFIQSILAKGAVKEVQKILLNQGRTRFGPPSQQVERTIAGIADLEHLERLTERLLLVSTWDELLAAS